jgi:antitoxin VapB
MALNIKDPAVEHLATRLAARLNTSKTGAIRHALREQLSLLESRSDDPLGRALYVLETEVWPITTQAGLITKKDREDILGYSADGV